MTGVSRETERPKHAQTSRHTDPPLTRTGRIGATAAVAAVSASPSGELIIAVIAIKLIAPSSILDLIAPTAAIAGSASLCLACLSEV
jgi:hypothetical protein